eukprot:GHUV01046718.1.p1 GENE.GHUV01046718.1~~GHUV01046718.1.p1  ORF type:complete len:113 (-),score=20.23 GHUV01046718.1:237-575(-)
MQLLLCIYARRMVGKAEPAIVVALYFHTSTMVMSAVPLAAAVPQAAAWLSAVDWLLLLGVAMTSFCGQLSLTRGFQLLDAGKAAGLNFSQVSNAVFSFIGSFVTDLHLRWIF